MADKEQVEVHKGLAGVVADDSAISKVMPETNSLTYRGYPVQQLADACRYEEVAYLLLEGELPTRSQLDDFVTEERANRVLSDELLDVIKRFPRAAHPMDALRTGVSYLGMEDPATIDASAKPTRDQAVLLLAKVPTIIAAYYRLSKDAEPIGPRDDLSFADNFLHMCFGEEPKPEIAKAFDVSLVLYAEHSFNASTFTTRVVTSTQSDIYSAIVAGVGALKGSLHGGANEAVMRMLLEIGEAGRAHDWITDALANKRKVMGFGHRVYRSGDSRVPTMKRHLAELAQVTGGQRWLEVADAVEREMAQAKDIKPNLDFPSGPVYYLMGFEIDYFTPIFAMARVAGWSAHILEQAQDNKLVRPLANYTGVAEREVVELDRRG